MDHNRAAHVKILLLLAGIAVVLMVPATGDLALKLVFGAAAGALYLVAMGMKR